MLPRPAALLGRARLLLLLLLPGTGSNPAENPPQQVNGMLGGSIRFPLKLPATKRVAEIEWLFQAGSGPKFRIAELRDGKLQQKNANEKFLQRLEMAEETTLRIRALQREDNGAVMAQVLFATGEVHQQTFLLSVFEPLPDPQIHLQVTSKTAEVCNVTLQCLATTENGAFNISWKRGNWVGALEEGSDRYQLSLEGTDLNFSWEPSSSDSTFTCLLSNPVDQKNVSFDLLSICQSESHSWVTWLLFPTLLILILAAGLGIYLCKKRASQGGVPLAVPEKEESPVVQYMEVQRRSPPEGNENQDPDRLAEVSTAKTPVTIYSRVQLPPST